MERLARTLQQFSTEDRLSLLIKIQSGRIRLTELARHLHASMQETSRHLSHLREGELVEKDPDGFYTLTSFGRAALTVLPSFKFLSDNQDYFLSHDLSALPPEFLRRIGELSVYEFDNHVGGVLEHTERALRESQKYVYLMADAGVISPERIIEGMKKGSAILKLILPKAAGFTSTARPLRTFLGSRLQVEVLDIVKVGIAMNERIAGVTFPDLRGKIDFGSGFESGNPSFHDWCRSLFEFYWSASS